jgi:hypothetical protein
VFKSLQSHRKDVREAAKKSPGDLEAALYTHDRDSRVAKLSAAA